MRQVSIISHVLGEMSVLIFHTDLKNAKQSAKFSLHTSLQTHASQTDEL